VIPDRVVLSNRLVGADRLRRPLNASVSRQAAMTNRRKPKKPVRNPSHVVFPRKGPVRSVVEQFPREQEDLEFTVGRKFLGALKHFEGIQLTGLCRGSEPADLMCTSSDGQTVGLQIVEVINQCLRQVQHQRSSYREALVQALGKDLLLFNGCRVSLVDSGEPPYLPEVASKDGEACLRVLADHLRGVAKEVHNLRVGKIRSRGTKTGSPERKVGVLIERILPAGEPVRLEFIWTGGGPSYRVDISRDLLTKALQSKVSKRYAKPSVGKFVLLAYSIDTLLGNDDPDISESRRILENSEHPFDEVWFLYPYAEKELGSLIRVWPAR